MSVVLPEFQTLNYRLQEMLSDVLPIDQNRNSKHFSSYRRGYFQDAHFIPIVGVGKRGAYYLVHGDLPRQHPFGTTLRFTGPVPVDSRQ